MTPEECQAEEDRAAALLAAYDEALAAGREPPVLSELEVPPELVGRVLRAFACLARLERLRRSARGGASAPGPAAPPGLPPRR